ncbi:Endonuclease/Exonuclease/phosphatase family protein [Spirosomataceae bacterium TFI 002]|nr:Endonuclease/Exonuclease/phosphatase family protein [Spirosomataceae bacterium TFI 002]
MLRSFPLIILVLLGSISISFAQVNLTGTSYNENFDGLNTGLPVGWTVRTGASASSLGNEEVFDPAHKTWASTSGGYRNCGSGDLTLTSSNKDTNPNRGLAIRQSGVFGDPGAAFTVQFANTLGFENFQLSFKLQSLNSTSPRVTEWQVQWASGANPTVFNTVICTPAFNSTGGNTISNTTVSCFLPASFEDISSPVWVRIVALSSTTGAGNRVTSGIDDFQLTYNVIDPLAPKVKIVSNFNSFSAIENSPSPIQDFVFSAVNLTDTAKIFAPTGYEIAFDNTFNDTLFLIPPVSGTIEDTLVKIRLAGITAGTYNGNLMSQSPGANTLNVPLTGVSNAAIVGLNSISVIKGMVAGTTVAASGRVSVARQFGGNQIFIQDNTGGISVYKYSGNLVYENGLVIGDSVLVEGELGVFNGLTQINLTNINKVNVPAIAPTPLLIDESDILLHEGELVKVNGVLIPGILEMDGQRNYTFDPVDVRIASPNNSLGYVNPLVGSFVASGTGEVIGVAGRFYDNSQLLPRLLSDIVVTGPPPPGASDETFETSESLDVVAWNLEWFGSSNYGPTNEALQKSNIKTTIKTLNADLFTFTEVSNLIEFESLVAELNSEGYTYNDTCSSRLSYEDLGEDGQRICFLYKPSVFSNVTAKHMFQSLDDSLNNMLIPTVLTSFPDDEKSRFWASGRLPFILTADVSLPSQPVTNISFVGVHARANTSTNPTEALSRYNMRKFDVEALKDSLTAYYPDSAIIMLGDFNDDLDFTVANNAGVPDNVSSYEAYINDPTSYKLVSRELSLKGKKSTTGFSDMIDHLITSNELSSQYIPTSVRVGNPEAYIAAYASTTTDHYPVMARFNLANICASAVVETVAISTGTSKVEAGYSVTASNSISGGANVTYDANNFVLLEPGFTISAADNTVFKAVIDGCGGN